ncbi:MAG: GPR endopeptidase [Oscillospiraceae bacterium]|nr:GPR endopeptidase [Oscillospiraceae bacterium]
MYSSRTDLAIEAHDILINSSEVNESIPGIRVEDEVVEDSIKITRVRIDSDDASDALGKEKGNYITLEIPRHMSHEQKVYEAICRAVARELARIIRLKAGDTVLVVGLGNWNITADSLGPKVVEEVMVTRHLLEHMPEEVQDGVRPVCAISPGVLGLTGVETSEITLGLVERVKPAMVIAIDALCSRNMERINTTIQIADTGITPGSGIGNKRMALNEKTLGVPVIAVGVPTVVDAATIADDSIELVLSLLRDELEHTSSDKVAGFAFIDSMRREDRYELIKKVISPIVGDMIVAPKDIDSDIDDIAAVVANGINISLHEGIGLGDIDRYK